MAVKDLTLIRLVFLSSDDLAGVHYLVNVLQIPLFNILHVL